MRQTQAWSVWREKEPSDYAKVGLGLELYSVRNELKEDLMGTVRAVAKMGYEGVEFYAPYF